MLLFSLLDIYQDAPLQTFLLLSFLFSPTTKGSGKNKGCYCKGNVADYKGNVARSFSSGQTYNDDSKPVTVNYSDTISDESIKMKDNINQTINKPRLGPSKFITRILSVLNTPGATLNNDEDSQRKIENLTFDEFESVFAGNKNKFMLGGINADYLNPIIGKYLSEKEDVILLYIKNLIKG